MQTPGSQITPMTSMVDSPAKRMNAAYERLLRREQDDSEGKGATVRALGSLLVSFEKVNSEMKVIRRDIRRDLREKRKYHSAETKLLKKEKNALEGLQSSVTNFRRMLGTAAFALAARDASEGDFGNALGNTGVGLAAFLPEIRDFVISILAIRGVFGGGRGKGNVPITGKASGGLLSKIPKGGMGKWGALGLTALGLLTLPSLLGGNANAKQVVSGESRRERVIAGEQPDIINRRDTNRFARQLDKFDAILRALSGDDKGVKPTEKKAKIPEITSSSDSAWKVEPSDSSSDNTEQRNKWQRFFDFGQIFSKDDPEEERTGEYTGGRPRWQRILDPTQFFSKDKKEKKVDPKDDLLKFFLLPDNDNKSLLTEKEFTTDLSSEPGNQNFIEGFNKKDQDVDWSKFYKQPPIINNLTNGETLEKGNKIEIITDGSEIDPTGPQSFSPFSLNNNSADSDRTIVDPNFYLSSTKLQYRLLMNQSSAMT